MSKVIKFVKKEAVLFISLAAALISMIFTPPNPEYLGYVDWSTLGLLFCLMAAVQGFGSIGAFSRLAGTLTRRFHSTRSLGAALVLMCFFLAMLVTNDVSLLTLVPLTIALFRSMPEICIRTVVLETAAANLGSMATPMGNPQNLYIYSHFSMPVADFFRVTLTGSGSVREERLKKRFSYLPLLLLEDATREKKNPWDCAGEDSLRGLYFQMLREQSNQPGQQETALLAAELSQILLEGGEVELP